MLSVFSNQEIGAQLCLNTRSNVFSTQTLGEVSQSTILLLTGKKTAIDWFQTHSYVQPVKWFN